jgi:hypothetical protein
MHDGSMLIGSFQYCPSLIELHRPWPLTAESLWHANHRNRLGTREAARVRAPRRSANR